MKGIFQIISAVILTLSFVLTSQTAFARTDKHMTKVAKKEDKKCKKYYRSKTCKLVRKQKAKKDAKAGLSEAEANVVEVKCDYLEALYRACKFSKKLSRAHNHDGNVCARKASKEAGGGSKKDAKANLKALAETKTDQEIQTMLSTDQSGELKNRCYKATKNTAKKTDRKWDKDKYGDKINAIEEKYLQMVKDTAPSIATQFNITALNADGSVSVYSSNEERVKHWKDVGVDNKSFAIYGYYMAHMFKQSEKALAENMAETYLHIRDADSNSGNTPGGTGYTELAGAPGVSGGASSTQGDNRDDSQDLEIEEDDEDLANLTSSAATAGAKDDVYSPEDFRADDEEFKRDLGMSAEDLDNLFQNEGVLASAAKASGSSDWLSDKIKAIEEKIASTMPTSAVASFEASKATGGSRGGAAKSDNPFGNMFGERAPAGAGGLQALKFDGVDGDIYHAGTNLSIFEIVSKKTKTVTGRLE